MKNTSEKILCKCPTPATVLENVTQRSLLTRCKFPCVYNTTASVNVPNISENLGFTTLSFPHALRASRCACFVFAITKSSSKLRRYVHVYFQRCFATAPCTSSTSLLADVLREGCALPLLTSKYEICFAPERHGLV